MKRLSIWLLCLLCLSSASAALISGCGRQAAPAPDAVLSSESAPDATLSGESAPDTAVPEQVSEPTPAPDAAVPESASEPAPAPFSEPASAPDAAQNIFTYDFTGKASALPTPSASYLPADWKGFNLLNLFMAHERRPFEEETFRLIAELGFNFVRLPMDYRCWVKPGGWDEYNELVLKQIDSALEYCIAYDIHLCLNFHRAPGYTVASPREASDLWTQTAPQKAFAAMWGMFAARYRNVPNEYLSFNLLNEPPDMDEAAYAFVMGAAAEAIRAQDPSRLIIADGLNYGMTPSPMIHSLGIAQATRGYQPFHLTHYRAEWADIHGDFPEPEWPYISIPRYLYGYAKRELRSAYIIEFYFPEAYTLDIEVGVVSDRARLVVQADGAEIYNKLFLSGPGEGEWTKSVYAEEWNIYQNVYDRVYRLDIPAGTRMLSVGAAEGDWMTISDMRFEPASGRGAAFSVTPDSAVWGERIPPIRIDADGVLSLDGDAVRDRKWLAETYLKPWTDIMNDGCGVMVGEWGAFNRTRSDVVYRWMEDCLLNYDRAGLGWALWNFEGSFGVLNSGRADVEYERFGQYRLDRTMLDLLQKHIK